MDNLTIKNPAELKIMEEGGKILSFVKNNLKEMIKESVNAYELERKAVELIKSSKAQPSFMMVPGYSWATCVNVNSGLVHGIPKKTIVFKKGDVVSVDVGVYYKGFHTDTSFTKAIDPDSETEIFLNAGREAFNAAFRAVKPGFKIWDISKNMEDTITLFGFSPVRDYVGHGIGKNLHEEPEIPCIAFGRREDSLTIEPGMAFAIEVMYSQGDNRVQILNDGWTTVMRDGKISALFEDTVIVTQKGCKIITG